MFNKFFVQFKNCLRVKNKDSIYYHDMIYFLTTLLFSWRILFSYFLIHNTVFYGELSTFYIIIFNFLILLYILVIHIIKITVIALLLLELVIGAITLILNSIATKYSIFSCTKDIMWYFISNWNLEQHISYLLINNIECLIFCLLSSFSNYCSFGGLLRYKILYFLPQAKFKISLTVNVAYYIKVSFRNILQVIFLTFFLKKAFTQLYKCK